MMRLMKGWISILILGLAACGAGDDTADGSRALCAEGGALTDCPDAERTTRSACWRMVDCGAIPLHHEETFRLDWDRCVDEIEEMGDIQQRLVINCIAAATCDQLKDNERPCFLLGEN
jgi:hypothetical protein